MMQHISYIWNWGSLCAGRSTAISRSFAAANWSCSQCGCPWAWSPLLLFTTQDESSADSRRMWELKRNVYL